MITGSFGTKNFEVSRKKIYTPNGIGISKELNLEETEVSGKEPTVKVKGIKLTSVSFELFLSSRFVDVLTELKFWDSTLVKKKAQTLKLGKWALGDYYLTSYNAKNVNIGKDGEYISAVVSLSFTDKGYVEATTTKTTVAGKEVTHGHTYIDAKKDTSGIKNVAATKVVIVKSTATNTQSIKKGSQIKPRSGTRWYYTAEGAYNKTGKSGKADVAVFQVYNTYKKNGKVVCVCAANLGGKNNSAKATKGWLKVSDVTVIKY